MFAWCILYIPPEHMNSPTGVSPLYVRSHFQLLPDSQEVTPWAALHDLFGRLLHQFSDPGIKHGILHLLGECANHYTVEMLWYQKWSGDLVENKALDEYKVKILLS